NAMGLIDVELLNLLIKLDEWFEKKRTLQVSETMRGDVLSLFCDKTVRFNTSVDKDSSILVCTSGNSDLADDMQCQNAKQFMNATMANIKGARYTDCNDVCDDNTQ
ncbi:hypothetical protein WUBG_19093, partial [Wuchereria bancrofti]